jgi:hypothetical protein
VKINKIPSTKNQISNKSQWHKFKFLNKFLIKPFDEEDLLKAVQEALKKDIVDRRDLSEKQRILQLIKSLTPPRIQNFNLCNFRQSEKTDRL